MVLMLNRIMMIAGEASGDLHGSGVVRELKKAVPELEIFGVGGDKMAREGMEIVYHISRLSFMGFVEVMKNLRVIREVEQELEELLLSRKPDVVVLIDYPGFNLRFAKKVKRLGIKVLYYIGPQIWAWHKSRVKEMRHSIDAMKVVFPFEVEFYRKEGIDVEFVGHPLAESIGVKMSRQDFFEKWNLDPQKKLLALLPGSRNQEIEKIFPVMTLTAEDISRSGKVQVAVGVAPNLGVSALRKHIFSDTKMTFVTDATYELMKYADVALVTSGTATLETGWFCTPMVIVYRTSTLTYLIGRMLVDVNNIGLVNIVAEKELVPEFIQNDMTPHTLEEALGRILNDNGYAQRMRESLSVIKEKLGGPGASARVAQGVLRLASAA